MAYWWSQDPQEIYWLEITDRDDIGKDLEAPQLNEKGRPFWSYSLVGDVKRGDIVLHYDKRRRAITSYSSGTGETRTGTVVWGARGASARNAHIKPHDRPGIYHRLDSHVQLERPVALERLRFIAPHFAQLRDRLKATNPGGLYLPFEVSNRRPLRLIQGYLAKFPGGLIPFLDELAAQLGAGPPLTPVIYKQQPRFGLSRVGSGRELAAYRPAVAVYPQPRRTREPNYDAVERGLRSHVDVQNQLEALAKAAGRQTHSPDGAPEFDLAWYGADGLILVEVKSVTQLNEERQLRMGLGQILRYKQQLEQRLSTPVRPVLAIERAPSDRRWIAVCDQAGVTLIWPDKFEEFVARC